MEIACLGWGSLIWDPRQLPLRTEWESDGPLLPIEFARESADGRVTLVLAKTLKAVPSLWALLEVEDIEEAKSTLAKREGITDKNIKYSIGYWDEASNLSHGLCSKEIMSWAKDKELSGVVWTNLKYGFKATRDTMPEIHQIVEHLNNLTHQSKRVAENYIRKTPSQVKTEYRSVLEAEFGWEPVQ